MVVLDADSVMTGECLSGLVPLIRCWDHQSSPRASGMDAAMRAASSSPPACMARCSRCFTARAAFTSGSWVNRYWLQRHYPNEAVHEQLARWPDSSGEASCRSILHAATML